MTEIPSEEYILKHRDILFRDEWLFYLLMNILFFTGHYLVMIPVGLLGATLIINSYRRQWRMEEMRFGK